MLARWTTLVEADDLSQAIDDPGTVVLDCRFRLSNPEEGRSNYAAGHIPGARYAHLEEDLSGNVIPGSTGRHPLPDAREFARRLSEWGISNASQVVAYDDSGGSIAARLWWLLKWLGHDAVAVLDGGWTAWQAGGHPESVSVPIPQRAAFSPVVHNELIVTTGEIAASSQEARSRLFDAREYVRYTGQEEPIDPVAGHVPGARSLPFRGNLDGEGKFLAPRELRSRFMDAGIVPDVRDTAFYCGSGVTAAHNVLAMMHAGLGMARLYVGSWSEWILDPDRMVALGDESRSGPG